MANRPGMMGLTSVNDLLGAPEDGITEIAIGKIRPYHDHPYKLRTGLKMQNLVNNIKENGILTPVLVRPMGNEYEMISGHNRLRAAELAGLTSVPAVVKDMTDNEAGIAVVDANDQRDEKLPSELAKSFKLKMECLSNRGARTDLTSGHDVLKLQSRDKVGADAGMTGRQVDRYIKLTELIPELLELVDNRQLTMVNALIIAIFDKKVQEWIFEYISENGKLTKEQMAVLKNTKEITSKDNLEDLLNIEEIKPVKKISFKRLNLDDYFGDEYSDEDREDILMMLLEDWKSGTKS